MRLILASGSPRRRDLLQRLQLPFEVVGSRVDERPPVAGENPGRYVQELALLKARDVAGRYPHDVVLGADTEVAIDGVILGKPRDRLDAVRMLALLRGRRHLVVTGVAVCCGSEIHVGTVPATVLMRDYTDDEVETYADTGEPMDKAGAYALQGEGGRLVRNVEGCFETVVGLPLCLTSELLARCGMGPPDIGAGCCTHSPVQGS